MYKTRSALAAPDLFADPARQVAEADGTDGTAEASMSAEESGDEDAGSIDSGADASEDSEGALRAYALPLRYCALLICPHVFGFKGCTRSAQIRLPNCRPSHPGCMSAQSSRYPALTHVIPSCLSSCCLPRCSVSSFTYVAGQTVC